jgi:rare lipoprotein A
MSRHQRRPGILLTGLMAAALLAGCAGNRPQAPVDSRSIITPERGSRGNPPFYEIAGQRYYVLDSSDGFRESGIASWYGRDFHGRSTSSGEIYDMNLLTAAHKNLPLPTWVEVTNLSNGRRVIVKVNDRGPFVEGRVIDLSRRAADELGMIESGTARVQVRALGAPASGPPAPVVAAAEQPRENRSGGGFAFISTAEAGVVAPDSQPFRPMYVQVGAFADRNNANKLAKQLKDGGFSGSFVLTTGEGRERIHRVRIGPVQANEYDRIRADLRAVGISDSRLVQDN